MPGRAASLQAFEEYFLNPRDPALGPGIYYRYRYADVEFFGLDTRYFRPTLVAAAADPDVELLGSAQRTWLIDALKSSTATFKILLSGARFGLTSGDKAWGPFLNSRDRLLAELRDAGVEGLMFASGGPHRSSVRLNPTPLPYPVPEFTSSPMSASASVCAASDTEVQRCVGESAQGVEVRSLIVLEFDTTAEGRRVRARLFADAGDGVVTEPLAPYDLLASELK